MKSQNNFKMHPCGLGTFLDIAARAICEKCGNGDYSAADIQNLQTSAYTALYYLGDMAEMLGMGRIDYINDPNNTSHSALMLFGRAVQELTGTLETITPFIHKTDRAATPLVDNEPFPPQGGC